MTDPLDLIEGRVLSSETRAVDVLALVAVARAARDVVDSIILRQPGPPSRRPGGQLDVLRAALARLEEQT